MIWIKNYVRHGFDSVWRKRHHSVSADCKMLKCFGLIYCSKSVTFNWMNDGRFNWLNANYERVHHPITLLSTCGCQNLISLRCLSPFFSQLQRNSSVFKFFLGRFLKNSNVFGKSLYFFFILLLTTLSLPKKSD